MVETFKAAQGQVSSSGRKYTLATQLPSFLGWKPSTIDFGTSIYYQAYEFGGALSSAQDELYSMLNSPNPVSTEALREQYMETLTARRAAFESMQDMVHAALQGGMSRPQVVQLLNASPGISREETFFLLNGGVPEWHPSQALLSSALMKAHAVYPPQTVQMIRQRYRTVMGFEPKAAAS